MVENFVRVDGEISQEIWEELTEYIDENKNCRRSSKKFYLKQISKLALAFKEDIEFEKEKYRKKYQERDKRLKELID